MAKVYWWEDQHGRRIQIMWVGPDGAVIGTGVGFGENARAALCVETSPGRWEEWSDYQGLLSHAVKLRADLDDGDAELAALRAENKRLRADVVLAAETMRVALVSCRDHHAAVATDILTKTLDLPAFQQSATNPKGE